MNNINSINNSAIIVYKYSSNPEGTVNNCKCDCTKSSINVLYPIDVCVSMEQLDKCYQFTINLGSIADRPVNVWINIMLPEYLNYDNNSFIKNGLSIGYVDISRNVCIGILQPGQNVSLSFMAWLNQAVVLNEICISTITYYNILIPYTAADWRCIEDNSCFPLNSTDI